MYIIYYINSKRKFYENLVKEWQENLCKQKVTESLGRNYTWSKYWFCKKNWLKFSSWLKVHWIAPNPNSAKECYIIFDWLICDVITGGPLQLSISCLNRSLERTRTRFWEWRSTRKDREGDSLQEMECDEIESKQTFQKSFLKSYKSWRQSCKKWVAWKFRSQSYNKRLARKSRSQTYKIKLARLFRVKANF